MAATAELKAVVAAAAVAALAALAALAAMVAVTAAVELEMGRGRESIRLEAINCN